MSALSEGVLFGLGNPLLDISCHCDLEFLDKFNLQPNNAILANDKQKNLCEEMISKYSVEYFAGGSVQNSMRVAQWFLDKPNRVTFMGAVGDDNFGLMMTNIAKKSGVNVVYMVDKSTPTGTCACLITDNGKSRSLCAYLGASEKFQVEHLLQNYSWVESARVFYVSGFHLAVSPDSILNIAKHAHTNYGKIFCMNLSAPYISQVFSEPLLKVFRYIDILFGNETEALAFATLRKYDTTDIKKIANLMANEECERKSGRTVIVTQGKDNVIVAKTNRPDVEEFEATQLAESKIIDTNGAGDAFVGGFFAQYIQNESLAVCIRSAIYAATEVIQLSGCTLPQTNRFSK